jgi:hypothetical protein
MAVPMHARFIFQGLWTIADRDGRLLEPHPLTLKARFLPADDVDAAAGLEALVSAGLALRYEVEGKRLLWLPGFRSNQNPHPKEVRSVLPPHPSDAVTEPRIVLKAHASTEGTTQTVMQGGFAGRDLRDLRDPSGPSGEQHMSTPAVADAPEAVDAEDPAQLLRDLWALTNPDLPQWQGRLNKQRRNAARRALERRPATEWGVVFRRIHDSDFLNSRGDRATGWRADLDWAIRSAGVKPEPSAQVLEGKYDNRTQRIDFRKGAVRAEDVDWSQFGGKTGDVTDEF